MLTITALLLDAEDFKAALGNSPEKPPQPVLMSLNLVLKKIISSRQSAYSTTIAEDAALLDDPTVQGRRRMRMAIQVRLGEKEILAMANDEVERRITKLDLKAREEEDTNQIKRRKV